MFISFEARGTSKNISLLVNIEVRRHEHEHEDVEIAKLMLKTHRSSWLTMMMMMMRAVM